MLSRNKGFTIIEALISIFLITAGIVGLSRAFSAGLFASSSIDETAIALTIAQGKMEDIKNTAFGDLGDSGPLADTDFPDFNVSVDIDEGTDPMQVDVTVSWQTKGGTDSVDLTTLITDLTGV